MIASYVPSTSEAHRVLRRTHKSGQLNLSCVPNWSYVDPYLLLTLVPTFFFFFHLGLGAGSEKCSRSFWG